MSQSDDKTDRVVAYYSNYDEQSRLAEGLGQVEFIRTQNILRRYLSPPPAVVLDIGGAAGRYALWLAKEGYEIHLIDPVPLHIEQAQAASAAQPEAPITSCTLGDARRLEFRDESAQAVLLLGPLYHLTEAQDRRRALAEAFRVLKPGGKLFAAGISRFASTIDGLVTGCFLDPAFRQIMLGDLESGQHRNPTKHPGYFTETFFHYPEELKAEVAGAGFETAGLFAVEGIIYMLADFEQNWKVAENRAFLLEILNKIEQESGLLGASPHLVCVGIKP